MAIHKHPREPDANVPPIAVPTNTQPALRVLVGNQVRWVALDTERYYVIGRDPSTDIPIRIPNVSRRHARLRVARGGVELEDLGSRNGTTVNGRRVVGVKCVGTGEEIRIGPAVLQVHGGGGDGARPELLDHATFMGRVDGCVQGARRVHARLSLLVVAIEVQPRSRVDREQLWQLFRAALQTDDEVAHYGANEFEILLPGATIDHAEAAAHRVVAGLAAHGLTGRVGSATWPQTAGGPQELVQVARVAVREAVRRRVDHVPGESPTQLRGGKGRLVGASQAYRDVMKVVDNASQAGAAVLVEGETGVGKEVVAAAIHSGSPRARGPLLRVNCAGASASSLELELFGYDKGARPGLTTARAGLFEQANGGTLLLHEIGELPGALQAKLLRVLDDKAVRRVGGSTDRAIEVRVVAISTSDLQASVRGGRFRQELFAHLAAIHIRVPPLRERRDDIAELAKYYVGEAAAARGGAEPRMGDHVLAMLASYAWPGNVRELVNLVERAVLLADGQELEPGFFPAGMGVSSEEGESAQRPRLPPSGGPGRESKAKGR